MRKEVEKMTILAWLKKRVYLKDILLRLSNMKLPKFDKEVELLLDSCPTPFDFTEVGNMSVEEIDLSFQLMRKINGIERQ